MKNHTRTVAFIDGNNLHHGIQQLGWKLDYRRFYRYLADQYQVGPALVFLGYLPDNRGLYRRLRRSGFALVFRPTSQDGEGRIKGNCDTDLAVRAVAGCCENRFQSAVLVSGDGDFKSVCDFLASRGKLRAVLAPHRSCCSSLLKRRSIPLTFLHPLRHALEYLPNRTSPSSAPSASLSAQPTQVVPVTIWQESAGPIPISTLPCVAGDSAPAEIHGTKPTPIDHAER